MNAYRALHDTIAFDDAIKQGIQLTDEEDTLIVVTADHSHTMSFGGYNFRGGDILGEDKIFSMNSLSAQIIHWKPMKTVFLFYVKTWILDKI